MSKTCKNVYVTTPIYYVNDVAHIGHAYTTIIADTLINYSKLLNHKTYFLTGTDEHGQKIEEAALSRGKTPKDYADEISGKFKSLWDEFDIGYDKFIRTTDEDHKHGVQQAFAKMYEKGDIYKGKYEGNYCVSCESFFTSTQLVEDEFCPDCGKTTKIVEEESYFFKLSKYEDKILEWYEQNEDCILPRAKKNEVISFVRDGLRDLSITRTSFDWGVKLPKEMNDDKHVMYVWLDALLNYVTALGYGKDEKDMDFWNNTIHVVGKDILKFHAIYWPAFLMSLDLPLPKHIAAHGWWTRNGEKMSKSKGNVVDPREVADAYGLENFRYFLMREVPFGQDGDFSQKALIGRINNDLSNDLGNLLNRIIGMSGKYFDFKIDSSNVAKYYPNEVEMINNIISQNASFVYEMKLNKYLENIWELFKLANNAITKYEPWNLMKENSQENAMALVALVSNALAKASVLLSAVMPKTMDKIASAMKFEINANSYENLITKQNFLDTFTISSVEPLFPKIENAILVEKKEVKEEQEGVGLIGIDEFFNSKIKVGTIVGVEEIEGSSKLYKIQVDIAEESPRQLVAGIRKYYKIEELMNTQVCVVSNLKPAQIMGIESNGMILAAKFKKKLSIISPRGDMRNGSDVG